MAPANRSLDRFGNASWDARLLGAWLSRQLAAYRWLLLPTASFLITRLGIVLVAYLAISLSGGSAGVGAYHLRGTENLFVDVFGSRWDTGFYVSIVEEGYLYDVEPFPNVAFFPLLPLAMRLLLPLTGDAVTAGILVANLALWGASILFYLLVREQWGERIAGRAVWYLLIFPAAFFGSAIYSESLFLLVTVAALLAGRRGHWWLAGLLGILATLSRLVGIIVVPLLLFEWASQWLDRERPQRPAIWTGIFPLLAPLGTLGYMFYLWRRFADPFGFATASAAWGRVAQSPWLTVSNLLQTPAEGWRAAFLAGHLPLNDWIDLLFVLLFFSFGIILMSQRRWAEGTFIWLGVMISFSSGLLMSQRRYMWVLFPAFILLARWGEKVWVDRLVTALSLLGLGLFTALFANGYWVG
ncbi:MAG: hypothetical protein KDE09_08530 [Anaerolineales bacterium]|nr:hypothetical protein [Anaerolineales bacterium]MCB0017822.1 hypothetical protein [Anaerolineales bacterium]